ncbi:MAG: hypothetical protein IJD31_06560 [Lachnospiraceae bacterium]|nr:hypothetical protein [Lachnospiraceae bacterium]
MLMFRELTPEENATIEKFHQMKGHISDLELRKLEKRKEIEYFEERKSMDYVPPVIWGLLTLSQVVLIFFDLFFGWWNMRFNWAIIMASLTPVLLIFFGFFFVKTLMQYVYRNSKNPTYMKKAVDKGIENRWVRSAKLNHELEQINAELRLLKKDYGYLKLEVDKIEANQYQ